MTHRSVRYASWFNDPLVCRDNRHGAKRYTVAEVKRYIRAVAHSDRDFVFAVRLKANKKHVGNISLNGISWANRSAEISILIGEKEVWGKGIGSEACQLLLNYAFKELDLHRVSMGMTTRNKPMRRIAKKLGMREEGTFREALAKNGRYLDIIQWALVNSVRPKKRHRHVS